LLDKIDTEVDAGKRLTLIHEAEEIMESDPPVLPVAWENILDIWYNYVKGHNPKDYFGIYDVVRFDTFWPGLFNAQYMTRMARIALMPPKAMRCRPSETL